MKALADQEMLSETIVENESNEVLQWLIIL